MDVPAEVFEDVIVCSKFISGIKSGSLIMIDDGDGNKYSMNFLAKKYG